MAGCLSVIRQNDPKAEKAKPRHTDTPSTTTMMTQKLHRRAITDHRTSLPIYNTFSHIC
jgi:hypothetical protein